MQSKLARHGHSHAVIIPASFLKKLSIRRGDAVRLEFDYRKGRIRLEFPDARQLRLEVPASSRRKKS